LSEGASCRAENIFGAMPWALRLTLNEGWEQWDAKSRALKHRVAIERDCFSPSSKYSTSSKN